MAFKQLGLIGCGLMGASFALALRKHGQVGRVVGYSPSPRTRDRAQQLGVIDAQAASAQEAAQGSDLVLIAVPVSRTTECLQAIAAHLPADALLMDVGSTKSDVVAAARATLGERLPCFVPAHPIAGKAQAGVDHAEAHLYQERRVILTPLPETDPARLQAAKQVWQAMGSHVSDMTPEKHDDTFAAVSHLPHLLAFAAVNALSQTPADAATYLPMAGPGFRDFSRIAASDPDVWHDILSTNRQAVMQHTQRFRAALDALTSAMERNDSDLLRALIAHASQIRSGWTLQAGDNADGDESASWPCEPLDGGHPNLG